MSWRHLSSLDFRRPLSTVSLSGSVSDSEGITAASLALWSLVAVVFVCLPVGRSLEVARSRYTHKGKNELLCPRPERERPYEDLSMLEERRMCERNGELPEFNISQVGRGVRMSRPWCLN